MTNTNAISRDVNGLAALAELLLWAGKDRVADAIYAALEAEAEVAVPPCADDWRAAFAG